jgi:hypothetical protein
MKIIASDTHKFLSSGVMLGCIPFSMGTLTTHEHAYFLPLLTFYKILLNPCQCQSHNSSQVSNLPLTGLVFPGTLIQSQLVLRSQNAETMIQTYCSSQASHPTVQSYPYPFPFPFPYPSPSHFHLWGLCPPSSCHFQYPTFQKCYSRVSASIFRFGPRVHLVRNP